MSDERRPVDQDEALFRPDAVFATPEEVLDHPSLSHERKAEILRGWEYDAAEGTVAEEEGMPHGDESDLLRRILLALEQLTGGREVRSGPTKQNGRLRSRH